jgi:cation transport ATPase
MKIRHELPGRIRLLVPGLWRKEDAIILSSYLGALDGIIKCSVNHRLSSALLIYDPEKIQVEPVIAQIKLVMHYLQSSPAEAKQALLERLFAGAMAAEVPKKGAAQKAVFFGLLYLLYKWKQARFGKFPLSRSVPWLQAASLVTIVGGYPLLKGYYKKCTDSLPGNSEDMLKQAAVFFTLVRESTKGILVLALKTFNDWIKFSADLNNHRHWQAARGGDCRLYIAAAGNSWKLTTAEELHKNDILHLFTGQRVPVPAYVAGGEAIIAAAGGSRPCPSGGWVKAGHIVREGSLKLRLLQEGFSRKEPGIALDNVHQPETPYERGISLTALSGAMLSYLFTGSALNAMAVLLLMSPSAVNAAVSSGLNNCVHRLSRQNVLVPDPNSLLEIPACRNLVIHQDLLNSDTVGFTPSFIERPESLGLQVFMLAGQAPSERLNSVNTARISPEELTRLPGRSILVCSGSKRREFLPAFTIRFAASPTAEEADIWIFKREPGDLPDILQEIWHTRKVIGQSVLFSRAFNIFYGAAALLQPFDAFAAKSLNTTNSLVALLSNQRIFWSLKGKKSGGKEKEGVKGKEGGWLF